MTHMPITFVRPILSDSYKNVSFDDIPIEWILTAPHHAEVRQLNTPKHNEMAMELGVTVLPRAV
jgi:hypothetical protein